MIQKKTIILLLGDKCLLCFLLKEHVITPFHWSMSQTNKENCASDIRNAPSGAVLLGCSLHSQELWSTLKAVQGLIGKGFALSLAMGEEAAHKEER